MRRCTGCIEHMLLRIDTEICEKWRIRMQTDRVTLILGRISYAIQPQHLLIR